MGDRLRPLWDFDDLDSTERRFRELLESEASDAGRAAEVLTQLARVEGLRGRAGEGERLLREAEAAGAAHPTVRARVALERGRLLRSDGDSVAAFPLFETAYEAALAAGDDFVAADAAHMAALAAGGRAGLEQAAAWAATHGVADSWFHEELAEEYAALGRRADAREQARRALGLIEPDDERAAGLRELAD